MDISDRADEIAIVGMSCRLPGAGDPTEYWRNLYAGVESIDVFSQDDLAASGMPRELLSYPDFVPAFGTLSDAYAFDAAFFRISQNEARVMDPQQRVFLECAWSALEDAGYDPSRCADAIGVFAGSGLNGHHARVLAHPELLSAVGDEVALLANNRDFLCAGVSYRLGLRGPSLVIQTACSTSLVAVHVACQSLLNLECDLALAGGVSIAVDQIHGYRYQEGGIRSRDGHCRAFDAAATGTVRGSGAGVVALKRLADALRDGDTIRAIVKGSAINNDGAGKIGFTAPSVKGQASVIAEALAVAHLEPSDISFIETHGTGTPLGDPIEIAALRAVFGAEPRGRIALGAVKTNIGHVDTASGVAGLIKTVLALQHRTLPPTLHFNTPNPETGLQGSPFYVNTMPRSWSGGDTPRRAGVSSFGIGGTNAHVVLEDAPAVPTLTSDDAPQVIVLSARSEATLGEMRGRLADHLRRHPDLALADVAFTLQEGRAVHSYRCAFVADGVDEAASALADERARNDSVVIRRAGDRPPPVAFLFPGQGSQYAGMARALYEREPLFRETLDRCLDTLVASCGLDLRPSLHPAEGREAEANERLRQTSCTQPALFAIEYALAKLWMARGVQPDAMLGHSIGEYVAACLAGVFSLDRALSLVAARGRLIQELPPGAMLAIPIGEEEARRLLSERRLTDRLSLAAINGATGCVVSGDGVDIAELETLLVSRQIVARRLATSHAFHSSAMDPILERFAAEVRAARPAAPCMPFLSNVTGDWITAEQATAPEYWTRHLRGTVRFGDGLRRLLELPDRVLLEVGPGDTLANMARRDAGAASARVIVRSLPRASQADTSHRTIGEAAGSLWTAGVTVDWSSMRTTARRRVPLPTYPFERTEYRVERVEGARMPTTAHADPPRIEEHSERAVRAERAERADRADRATLITARLSDVFARVLGTDEVHASRTFLDQGADSLLLMQASRSIESALGVRVPFRWLVDRFTTVEALSAHLDRELPADARVVNEPATSTIVEAPAHTARIDTSAFVDIETTRAERGVDAELREIVNRRLAVMRAQLDLLSNDVEAASRTPRSATPLTATPLTATPPAATPPAATPLVAASESLVSHGPHRPIQLTIGNGAGHTESQAKYFEAFERRYTARTERSKRYAAENRSTLADSRNTLGFRLATKELVYPIVGERSDGARLWDLDGNEYIDFTMGFGVHLFGHRPPFVVDAVDAQWRRGVHLGPQSDLAGPAARLFCELTGLERATFCNTGSEAVMTALRLARTATARERIVVFEGSYHGIFDGVLARAGSGRAGEPITRPVAAGIPQRMVDDVVVLPYGTDEALDWLKANAHGLAAVLVEPVQARRLELHPREFLRQLRALTERTGTVLIFDEMVTGFRLGIKGAQGFYGIDADLATYGKVIGGGFPLGVVAGRARLMDAIDGGSWAFGDDSYPAANQTFFAGTFCKHPIAMAATCAVLRHIQQQGPALYEHLNARTARLVAALRQVIAAYDAPLRIETCASRFTFRIDPQTPIASLLFYHLIEHGMYVWEGRGCFLSTAHVDADCDRLVNALDASLRALRAGGFLAASASPEPSSPEPADLTTTLPMTPAQRQVWVHAQLGPDASRAYHEQVTFALRGAFDVESLRLALDDVTRHHDGLRTTFDPSGETQHIQASMPIAFRVIDLPSAAEAEAETGTGTGTDQTGDGACDTPRTSLRELMREAARETFDLAEGPLLRAYVYRRAADDHVVQIVYHHIAIDGFAFTRVQRDLEAAYRARRDGRTPHLPAAMQLGEYVGLLAGQTMAHADREAEWLQRFAGAAPLVLQTDRPRSALPAGTAAQARASLDPALAQALTQFGRQQGCTLFMTLFSGLLATLHRLAAQDDIVVGISSVGRPFEGAESVVGHCVDVLPIRSRIARGDRILPFVGAVRSALLDAYEHEVFSWAHLSEKLRIARTPGAPSLVSVTFNIEPRSAVAERRRNTFADLAREEVAGRELFARFDLHIDAMEVQDRIELLCRYNAELFDAETIDRLLARFTRVLEQMVSTPDAALADLDLLGEAERRLAIEEWNRTAVEYHADPCVHRLFEAHVRRIPNDAAVVCGGRTLTYRELNDRANQLAHRLRALGIGPDIVVGMYFDRSLEAIVALLGILKAGGAYLPLDPALPHARLHEMLDGAGAKAIVAGRDLPGSIAMTSQAARPVIRLDDEHLTREPRTDLAHEVSGEHLAYVIFTSGSTGRPKGVAVEHRQLANYVFGLKGQLGLTSGVSYATVSTLAADLGNTVVFSSLAWGGCLHVITGEDILGGDEVARYVEQHRIDCLKITPSHLAALQHGDPTRAMPRRWLVLGGEASSRAWVDELRRASPSCAIVNHYGPTETTVGVLTCAMTTERLAAGSSPSSTCALGRPLPNTRVFVTDARIRPVPIGSPGELMIGGAQVARGYIGQPGLTAERFVPDPFAAEPGARMYRTGDRVRWLVDGVVEFLGRVDRQVKIRGVRVELGEIEATLRRHAQVRECAAVADGDASGDRRIVAYVVGDVLPDDLRAHAASTLPEAMVPSAIVVLDALPLTPNGKVDYRALPAPAESGSGADQVSGKPFLAPRTPVEEVLTGMIADLLGLERVSVEDNFFALGGHSLLAMRTVMRIRELFGIELPVREFFDAPTLAALAGVIGEVRRAGVPALPPIGRAPRTEPPRLSFAQERLWFLDRLKPGGTAYNLPVARRFSGALSVSSLEHALGEIIRRHDVLRTTFVEVDGTPAQVIAPFDGFSLSVEDLSGWPEDARDTELRRRLREEASRPCDLTVGPLFRQQLFRLGSDEHVLLLCMHHAIGDGWSIDVLFRELTALYHADREGRASPLADVPVQYADYAIWQRAQLQGEVLERQLAYWRERLAGAPQLMPLPLDHPRPATQTDHGARELVELPHALLERLLAMGRREGATLYMVLLGAFQVLLARSTGIDDVVVGSPIAGRTRPEVEGLIGFFVNTLVLRTDLSGDPTFRDVLRRVRQTTLGAYQHQDVPFEQLVAELQPQRSMTHSPIFQVMFSLHQVEEGAAALSDLRIERLPAADLDTTKFDLIFEAFVDAPRTGVPSSASAAEGARGPRLALTYRTQLFERSTIQRMLAHLTHLLQQVADAPDRHLSRWELLEDAERTRIVEEWNATAADYPDACLHDLFEAQVARTPNATAVVHDGVSLSYADLNRQANRLAHHLRARGVGPDVPVGICVERGPEMLVGLFAILKAGGVYVPLDRAHPPERLRGMLEDSRPIAVLIQEATHALLGDTGVPTIDLDRHAEMWAARPDTNPERGVLSPDHLCYVMYTSGSTGRPKGVMNQHRCVVNRLVWGQRAWDLRHDEATLGHTPLTFDGSLRELFWPLTVGARVVFATRGDARDPDTLIATIRRDRVTTINLVPSMLQFLLEHPAAASCSSLRRVLCGGEVLAPTLLQRVRDVWPQVVFHHMYGPTEAATAMTALDCAPAGARRVPIGRPTANVQVYLRDRIGRPVPVGVLGELFIGGAGVARGYLGRPGLTADRFVPDPFSATEGARLYRTGDLARWLPNGAVEFHGRNDFQVKVRGVRIEPGEIEVVLRRHPEISTCVVVPQTDGPHGDGAGDAWLVAYYVGSERASAPALRAHLAAQLPEYMVPAAYVRLDALPLTPTGKIDRAALPIPDHTAYVARAHEEARDEIEAALAEIWAEVLRLPRVGRWDHFFELGGHSLRAVQVISRVRQVLAVDIALQEIFLHPVLMELAERVRQATRMALPPIERAKPAERLGLSFAQQRLWFMEQAGQGGATFNICIPYRLRGALDRRALEQGLGEILRRHEALRTTFGEVDGVAVQMITPFDGFTLHDEDLSTLDETERVAEVRRRTREERARRFDLTNGPLFRAWLLRLAQDDHVLLLAMHHMVSDGWSIGVIFRELSALYDAYRDNRETRESPLPPLAVQYADYAAWQRAQMRGETLATHLGYWTTQLSGAPALMPLPSDRPRPPQQSAHGAIERIELSAAMLERLQALGYASGATLYMVLLAAFQLLLGRYTATEDIVVGTPVAGRTRPEVEPLIGLFLNMLVLRTDLSGNPTFRELLGRVRANTLAAYEHQDVPFEQLVDALRPVRTTDHTPLFQVFFEIRTADGEAVSLSDLATERLGTVNDTTKFDLHLDLVATPGAGLAGALRYRTELYERATIRRMIDHLERVLMQITADPDIRLSAVTLLSASEPADPMARPEPDVAMAATSSTDLCVHQLFERQAALTPDAPAVAFGGDVLTYADLDRRATRLAHDLRRRGVGLEVRVGLCLPRGPELIVALVATLKAGGAYVPLDPGHPVERLSYLLADASVAVLITQERLRAQLPIPAGVEVVSIDDLSIDDPLMCAEEATGVPPAVALPIAIAPDNLCYVIYTSGSTGRPKGVAMHHRGVANYIEWARRAYQADRGGAPVFTSLAVDLTVTSLLPIFAGQAVSLMPEEEPIEGLIEVLRTAPAFSLIKLTPLHMSLLSSHLTPDEARGAARTLVIGGEVLQGETTRWWQTHAPAVMLVNEYGPTETVVGCSAYVLPPEAYRDGAVPVGRPITGLRFYVLDTYGGLLPMGLPGELFIGGVGVARGYLGRPGLTAWRFVPDPCGAPGARMYRTGDRALWRADGSLMILGRTDHQVKVRGYRVELGEIEAVLRQHRAVRDCAVVLRADQPDDPRLVAYVVIEDVDGVDALGDAAAEDALRAHARRSLPDHMVPSAFVRLEALPQTSTGKLDRAALPAPELASRGGLDTPASPRSAVEQRLAEIWAQVLKRDHIGATDNFFELGGHSLLVMRLTAQLRKAYGLALSIRTVLDFPTVRGMAEEIERLIHEEIRAMPEAEAERRAELDAHVDG